MKKILIEKGQRHGRLNVIGEAVSTGRDRMVFVECDCGKSFDVRLASLRSHKTKSCGCLNRENQTNNARKHGHNTRKSGPSRTYYTWSAMIQRCTNPKDKSYGRYGAKGIKVSENWLKFENFLADMGEKPDNLTLERIDGKKGYNKENCKWATILDQGKNRSSVHWIEFEGKRMTARDWAKEIGLDEDTIYKRIKRGVKLPELLSKRCKPTKK